MSPRRPADPSASGPADHARARELAALRLDEPLPTQEAAWLDDHLAACDPCRAVAADYDLGRSALRALRVATPQAPRDLWARTSAALEAERGLVARRGGHRSRTGWRLPADRLGRLALAPLAGLLVVAVVVGSGLLGGRTAVPDTGALATPIALTASTDLRVLTRASDGTVSIVSGQMTSVCPIGTATCGAAPSFAVTQVEGVRSSSDLAAVSPAQDRIVVTENRGVFILPMAPPQVVASQQPSPHVAPAPTHGPSATPSDAVTTPSTATHTATPAVSESPTAIAASASPVVASPSPTEPSGPSGTPSASDATSPAVPTPSVAVSPAPGGAIQIASDVTVIGDVVYSPDGTRVAFAARPSDGSTGPDIFVWTTGDASARALTTDHASMLAGWTAAGLLVGRVVDGKPSTDLVNPATGASTALPGSAWMPVANPAGTRAAWWDGTVKLAADGVTWVPDAGRLVLGAWPPAPGAASTPAASASAGATSAVAGASSSDTHNRSSSGATASPVADPGVAADPDAAVQVITDGPVDAWAIRWDEGGTDLAVWLHQGNAERPGRLSLYSVDPATGIAALAHPLLDAVPAAAAFSLRTGRLVWSGPGASGQNAIQVLAWNGTDVGRLELPAGQGATVVP